MEHAQLKFMIIGIDEINNIDISDIMDESLDSLIKSNNGKMAIVKWERDDIPPSIELISDKQGPYTQSEIQSIIISNDWK